MLCEYGCGKEAEFILKNGKECCSYSVNQCSGKIIRQTNTLTGKKASNETKKLMSETHKKRYKKNPELKINALNMGKNNIGKLRPDVTKYNLQFKIYDRNPANSGNYCSAWPEISKQQREDVKTCRNPQCKYPPNKLVTHHIDYNKKHCQPKNLIVICNSCNLSANYNRDWHISYYTAVKGAQNSYQI